MKARLPAWLARLSRGRPGALLAASAVVGGVMLAAALAALSLRACGEEAGVRADPAVVAMVNDESVTRAAFEAELRRETRSPEGQAPSPEQVERVKRALLDSLVDRVLLLQAAKAAGVQLSTDEVDRRVLRMGGDYPAEGFEAALAQGQLSLSELKERTAQLLLIEKLFEGHVYPRVAITEAQIRTHFEQHKARYQRPEQVRAAQLVVKTMDEARRVQALLRGGQKFPDLARKYSLSADAKVGGDLGFFERGVMPPVFDQVAFRLGVGEVSEVVETEYGFHLFKVLARRPPETRELVEVRPQVEAELLKAAQAKAQEEYLAQLRAKAKLQVNEASLAQVTYAKGR